MVAVKWLMCVEGTEQARLKESNRAIKAYLLKQIILCVISLLCDKIVLLVLYKLFLNLSSTQQNVWIKK